MKIAQYTADLQPDGEDIPKLEFWIEQFERGDEPWRITSGLGSDTHHTLDELLFWNLGIVSGERHITEAMRKRILAEFGQT